MCTCDPLQTSLAIPFSTIILLDGFHKDRPKSQRGTPIWNLFWVLRQPKKPPFEPLKDSSLNHLTFKMVFLLALRLVSAEMKPMHGPIKTLDMRKTV